MAMGRNPEFGADSGGGGLFFASLGLVLRAIRAA